MSVNPLKFIQTVDCLCGMLKGLIVSSRFKKSKKQYNDLSCNSSCTIFSGGTNSGFELNFYIVSHSSSITCHFYKTEGSVL